MFRFCSLRQAPVLSVFLHQTTQKFLYFFNYQYKFEYLPMYMQKSIPHSSYVLHSKQVIIEREYLGISD